MAAESSGAVAAHKAAEGPGADACDALAYPLIVDEQICGAAALEIERRPESLVHRAMRQLQWGSAWLEVLVRRTTEILRSRSREYLPLRVIIE